MLPMSDRVSELTPEHQAWLAESQALWREAHEVVSGRPDLDVSDVYHVLRNLKLSPADRLRRGLTRVRVRPHIG